MVAPFSFEVLAGALRGDALVNWLRTDGAAIFELFPTRDEAAGFLRDLGVKISNATLGQVRNEVLNVLQSANNLIGYPDNQLIPLNWHVSDHGLDLTSDFQYRIHVFGADRETGLLNDQWFTIASDRQLTRNEVVDAAGSYVGEGGDSDRVENVVFGEIEPLMR